MRIQLIIPPADEPLVLANVKTHLRVDDEEDEGLITALITVAREAAEQKTGRVLIDQTWDLILPAWPADDIIEIPLSPVSAVESIKYYDADNVQRTIDASAYQRDTAGLPPRILPSSGQTWPSVYDRIDAIAIRFTAGYGAAAEDVPAGIRQWMLLQIGAMYDHRATVGDRQTYELPFADRLLDPYRVIRIG